MGPGANLCLGASAVFTVGLGVLMFVFPGQADESPGYLRFLGVAAVGLGLYGLVWLVGVNSDGRTRVCTVTERLEKPGYEGGYVYSVRTDECGTLKVRSTATFAELRTEHAYRLRIQGGRWFTKPAIQRIEGEVPR